MPPNRYTGPSQVTGNTYQFSGNDRYGQAAPPNDFTFRSNVQPPSNFNNQSNMPPYGPRAERRDHYRHGPGPKPQYNHANYRPILQTKRETTPEQFMGMRQDGPRFKAVEELTETDAQPAKKVKLDPEASKPAWSNPDPYFALPPVQATNGKKTDVLSLIRNAKKAASDGQGNDVLASNADFISLSDEPAVPSLPPRPAATVSHPPAVPSFPPSTAARFSGPPAVPTNRWPQPPPQAMGGAEGSSRPPQQNAKKRKRQEGLTGEILPEWAALGPASAAPWCKAIPPESPNVNTRFHTEIHEFFKYVKPSDLEDAVRRQLVVRVQDELNKSLPSGQLMAFGSFASGIYLPTADMDLVFASPNFLRGGQPSLCQSKNSLHRLGRALENGRIAKTGSVQVVANAKVPIIKFVDRSTELKVDISFENLSGVTAVDTFKTWKVEHPEMPILVALIKQFVLMRGLNEVFSGGIGGFTIICLVVHFMRTHPAAQKPPGIKLDYGEMFLAFLDYYGNQFDLMATGISMKDRATFKKVSLLPYMAYKPHLAIRA